MKDLPLLLRSLNTSTAAAWALAQLRPQLDILPGAYDALRGSSVEQLEQLHRGIALNAMKFN